MNPPYRCAGTTKLKRNAAGGLFKKPSFFLFFRLGLGRLFGEPFEKEEQRFPILRGDNGDQLPSLFSVLRQTNPLEIQKGSLVQSAKIGLPDHILPFHHEKPHPPFRSAFAYHTDFYPQINKFFETRAADLRCFKEIPISPLPFFLFPFPFSSLSQIVVTIQ